jgi:hypothetical protein
MFPEMVYADVRMESLVRPALPDKYKNRDIHVVDGAIWIAKFQTVGTST